MVKTIIVIPVEEDKGDNSKLSQHFGRAPYLAIVEIKENNQYTIQIKPNSSQHFGGYGLPSENILKYKPDAVITYGMGPRAIQILSSNNVEILSATSPTLKENIEKYLKGQLKNQVEPCDHPHRK
ncbi:MAG: NifB/NifX family molybdenum-iron cluster-binding protein [Candidatus Odinarchaeum yellowstonii]|uniref:NifB/NifX family molybdenum-iron cluster-binding protein n=1 Tax=Odinarchaeota yellowstonii (strain LCB_4) TaxID=1841599 RepID=A0AAF0D1U8_ODILC|nr:MAG: NifB/NifX family molybdenum-iron cluster-binding protein [Candidatus Odinarchaeum yellowstonii]